ncbi:MAG: DUF3443 family protein [Steroidobacteraceae bacterium]
MARFVRAFQRASSLILCVAAVSCGGADVFAPSSGGPTPTGTNVVDVIVDQGPVPATNPSVNTLFVSVTVCVPGTANCQTIDHIEVDTGSYGLRILASVLNATLNLPLQLASNGNSLVECTQFVDGYSWGPIVAGDLQIGGETASSVPIQSIGDSRFASVPSDCSAGGGMQEDTVATFGANGILGIGPFVLDCPACETQVIPGTYYACTSTTCTGTTVDGASQVPNPVTKFAKDNNGTIIQLPSVASAGAATVSGTLTFGIDTEPNNASGTETVLTVDDNADLIINFGGVALSQSFIDSGSNANYFNDSTLVLCTNANFTDFYCPANTVTLPVTIQGLNGVMTNNLTFQVGNAVTMFNNPAAASYAAFPLLAGTNPNPQSFDFGLGFYYSQRVATAIEGNTTTVGTGPYVAF